MYGIKIKGAEHRNIILCYIFVKAMYFKCLYSTIKIHMNKKHWNTVMLNGSVPDKEVFTWIDHSFNMVSGNR